MTAGKVRTVLGDVEPSALGITLTHEHVLITFGRWRLEAGLPRQYAREANDPRAYEPITLQNVAWIRRYGSRHPDNHGLTEEDVAIDEVRRFKQAGGGTIVDATNPDLKRDPEALARISRATGVQIVMGAGHYVDSNHPLDMDSRTEDQIVEEIITDVTQGCDGTSYRAGIIGEIGCSEPEITPNERKCLRAAARAQQATGAPLLIHPGRTVRSPFEAMRIITDASGDPQRTIMSHIDRTLFDLQDMIALARTGCYVEFDLFGHESSYYGPAPIDMPNDAMRINYLQGLIAAGFGDKLVIAQDICAKPYLCAYGGEGYAHILENVVPIMKRKGMTEDQIEAILVHNPARVLPMVPVATPPVPVS